MSETVTCERCGKPGRRLICRVAPEGWWFGSFTLASDGAHDPGDTLIAIACSVECREALWTKQDGHKWDAIERRVNVASEIRRFAALAVKRLRDEAGRIKLGTWVGSPDSESFAGARVAALLEDAADHLETSAENEVEAMQPQCGTGGA